MAVEIRGTLTEQALAALLEALQAGMAEVIDLQISAETVRAKDEDGYTIHEPTGRHFLRVTYGVFDEEQDGTLEEEAESL